MSLIKCKECNGEVSTKADACPACGAKQNVGGRALGGCVFAIIWLLGMSWFFGWNVTSFITHRFKSTESLTKELDAKCLERANDYSPIYEIRRSFYENCLAAGKIQLQK